MNNIFENIVGGALGCQTQLGSRSHLLGLIIFILLQNTCRNFKIHYSNSLL